VRGVIAVVGLLAGCDALWRIDSIEIPNGDARPQDGSTTPADARPHTGPFAHFTMDQIDGFDYTTDSSGNYQAICEPTCPGVVGGHRNNALQLNTAGTLDQRLQIAAVGGFQIVDEFSVVGWIRLTTLAVESCPWSKPYSSGAADSWQVCINPSGAVSFITYGVGGSNQISTAMGWATLDGVFHHVAIVYDGVMKTLYWDGEIAVRGEGAVPLVDDDDVVIGNDADGTMYVAPFAGALDELGFYDYALTPAEVAGVAAQ
jgi:hypothetical protein